jgi:hypothetical protein
MATGYYAYVMGEDGRVEARVAVVCENDEEARQYAEQLVDGHAIELWQEARWVATFHPRK